MRKYLLIIFLLSAGFSFGQKISIDESEAEIRFIFLDDDVEGTLSGFKFTGSIDLSDLSNTRISGSVETATLDTNNWLRSRHLRSKKYFSAKAHPKLTYKGIFLGVTKDGFTSSGELSIKGVTRTVTFNFTDDGSKLTGKASLNTHDFDISIHDKKDRNKVDIEIVLPYSQ